MPAHVSPPKVITGKHDVSYETYLDQVKSRFPKDQRDSGKARTAQLMMRNLGVDTQWMSRPLDSDVVAGGGRVGERNEATLEDVVAMATEAVEQALLSSGVAPDAVAMATNFVEQALLSSGVAPAVVAGGGMVGERNEATLEDVVAMATEAVEQALLSSGVAPEEIDAVVLSNVTYWGAPGIISHLVEPCGFREDIRKIELGSAACAGGVMAFANAFDYIAAHPDARVVVLVPERLSTITHRGDTEPMDIVYGRTFSDVAAASVVSGYRADDRELRKRLGPGMVITHCHEYQLPKSLKHYFSELNATGKHFGSDKKAPKATGEIIPKVIEWMEREGIPAPEWVALHSGSAYIIEVMAKALGIDPDVKGKTRFSHKSLAGGNKGGASVMEVLAFTCDDPPAEGAPGLMAAPGPGVNFATCAGFFTHG